MGKIKNILWTLAVCYLIFIPGVCSGAETDIFLPAVNPDALIILDLSGSMGWTPAGQNLYSSTCPSIVQCYKTPGIPSYAGPYYATQQSGTSSCAQSIFNGGKFDKTTACTGPFYIPKSCVEDEQNHDPYSVTAPTTPSGYTVQCDRFSIAKRTIFSILDADGNGTVNSADNNLLGIRFGYMHFSGCGTDEDDGNPLTGCIQVLAGLTTDYSSVWNAANSDPLLWNSGTPIAAGLAEATSYLTYTKNGNASLGIQADPAAGCPQKFAILITDGADTNACSATSNLYKNRKASVAKAYALAQAGYKLFVVGFAGDFQSVDTNTLNWMAYYGDPKNTTSGQAITPSASPCTEGSTNDPGSKTLSGYAFVTSDPASLVAALTQAINTIRQATYSFSTTSVSASRTSSENYLYEASFMPRNGPFWDGYLKKYNLNSKGAVGSVVWEAGNTLNSRNLSSSPRNIFTYRGGSFLDIGTAPTGTTLATWLGVGTNTTLANSIVAYIEGSSTPDNWRLGDIFNSNPVVIGSPSAYYTDPIDTSSPQAYAGFLSDNQSRQRLLVAGANDGQLHAFQPASTNGTEQWSFDSPNLQQKLQYLYHATDPAPLSQVHTYFVDGPITVADVWLGRGSGTSKSKSDWKSLLVFGEGRGVRDQTNDASNTNYLWSSSQYCDSNFNPSYTTTYKYYCGYHALDVTNTAASLPSYMWRVNADSSPNLTASLPYLGEPWSKMAIGKVIINGSEKWVGFIGAGYPSDSGNTGRAFFAVGLSDGSILWSFTKGNNSNMTYGIPASPAIVDTNNDGFIDTAYVGDLGGNLWRFNFCTNAKNADASSCGTGNWSGGLLFNAQSSGRPIYTAATIARDTSSLWVFWGTGDKESPTSTTGPDSFFAVKDNDRVTTYILSNLQSISAQGATYNGTSSGWYITFGNGTTGEKDLADPTVFGGIVMFTTYTPDTSDANPCKQVGSSNLYAVAMMQITMGVITYNAGAGVLTFGSAGTTTGGAKSASLASWGTGMAKSPIVSQNYLSGSATNVYITLSGGADQNTDIITTAQLGASPLNTRLSQTTPSTQILHWKDGRIQ